MSYTCPHCLEENALPPDAAADSRLGGGEIKLLFTFKCSKCSTVLEYFEDGVLLDYAVPATF